jgi:hypothetical protein
VVAAGQEDVPGARQALELLCQRTGLPFIVTSAGKATTGLVRRISCRDFSHLPEKHGLQTVKPQKYKFRSFLLVSLKNFVADERRRAQSERRGGKCNVRTAFP